MTMDGHDAATQGPSTTPQPVGGEAESEPFDREKARRGVRLLLEAAGRDPESEVLRETWERRGPETWATLTEGTRGNGKPELRTFPSDHDELVVKTDIPFYSLCEHHLLPYHGRAHLAYRPEGHVAGLSKLVRYVRWQSRRLTIQEQLTENIASGLATELPSDAVLVQLTAAHLCEAMRGVEVDTTSRTLATAGDPTEEERRRFLDSISGVTP